MAKLTLTAALSCWFSWMQLLTLAAPVTSADCPTQKMLISCYLSSSTASSSVGAINCGYTPAPSVSIATEVLLNWNPNVSSSAALNRASAQLSIELSKPPGSLSLVLLDLSSVRLCVAAAAASSADAQQLQISFPTYTGATRLAIRGLRLPGVTQAVLHGGVVINADLLKGLPRLQHLVASGNNVTQSPDEPLANYAISDASQLQSVQLLSSIHSAAYGTPLLNSLPSLHSVRIARSNMLLLKSAILTGLTELRYLYLTENNIRRLEPDSLAGLTNLQQLYLQVNGLSRLENYAFRDLVKLQRLNLARNRLVDIQPNAFHGLVELTHLDLSDNQLTSLSESVFSQLHGLQTLNLQGNSLSGWAGNDTFCPLTSLQTLWTDAPPLDCAKFGCERLVQHVQQREGGFSPAKKYNCDMVGLAPERRPCHRWLDRLTPSQQTPKERPVVAPAPVGTVDQGGRRQPTELTIILLIVFSMVCLIHVLTTGVTVYVCRRMRRESNGGGRSGGGGVGSRSGHRKWNDGRRAPSLTTPLEEDEEEAAGRSLKAVAAGSGSGSGAGGGSSDGALVSFQSSGSAGAMTSSSMTATAGNGSRAAGGKTGGSKNNNSHHTLIVKDKSYDFNEDEPRS